MKKTYKEPMMIVERFTLSQTIATGCGDLEQYGSPTLTRRANCAWDFFGATTIFLEGNEQCLLQVEDGAFEGLCYNAPSAGLNLFHS